MRLENSFLTDIAGSKKSEVSIVCGLASRLIACWAEAETDLDKGAM